MKKTTFGWIETLIIIGFVLFVYFVLTRIFGQSANLLMITITFFLVIGGLSYRLNREFGEFRIKVIHSFDRLGTDMGEVKGSIATVEEGIGVLKTDVKQLKTDVKRLKTDIDMVKSKLD